MTAQDTLRFDGRVAIITGAGGGLGKAYSLFLASRGASVVVNDLGGSHTGDGSGNHRAADVVVNQITSSGGKAVANYDSVVNGDKIVETAIKAFGRVDIVINNAGILRDKSFARMTDDDWDLVHQVHVKGTYAVTKAAYPIMLKQGYGRIITTSSAAGLYGNYGQANYSAAKMEMVGFTTSLAREGERKGVLVNTIAPLAASRMTETVLPKDVLELLKPEFVVPVVSWLCHETSRVTGQVVELGAGFVSALRYERSNGYVFKPDATFTPAAVKTKWTDVTKFVKGQVSYPKSIVETDWVGLLDRAKNLKSNDAKEDLRFDGRVVVVTGAGNGLGRAYAHMFAKLGASVVVNDLGGSTNGVGGANTAADKVVEEIKAMGGKAVANYDSVEEGEKVIETAIKAFGRVDVVVNNAGILRDKSFIRMTDGDWDLVQRVHMRGAYKVTKAAWPYFLKQKYGRVVNTSSAVGLYGNFGQVNYSAAKAGVIAFSNTLGMEGKKSNIVVNTIAPNAGTRMTATVMPAEMVEALKPEYVAPLVGWLSHEHCQESGSVFEVGSCWVSKVRWQRSGGVGFPVDEDLVPEKVRDAWPKIVDFEDGRATYPASTQESFMAVQHNFDNRKGSAKSSGNRSFDVEKVKNTKYAPMTFDYTERDVILYALGVGAKRDELQWVYENDAGFKVLPTYSVIPALTYQMKAMDLSEVVPNFNPMMLLHGEQKVIVKKPMKTSGRLTSVGRIVDVLDKGKAASVVISVVTTDESGDVVAENESTIVIRGSGGFGGSRGKKDEPIVVPKRSPDFVLREKTSEEQAALYRLSGDYNPLHIDPEFAKVGGFSVPILHGLSTLGHAVRLIVKKGIDVGGVRVRFTKEVIPGQVLEVRVYGGVFEVVVDGKAVMVGELLQKNKL